jgi:hypothetical protein
MSAPAGDFYSAEDADSGCEEGKFYRWTKKEIRDVLGEDAEFAIKVFSIEGNGNFPSGKMGTNILHIRVPLAEIASGKEMPENELRRRLENIQRRLLASREKRIRPHRDDTILAD